MPVDPELDLRGRLIRGLGALREMLPGSFIERSRRCGKPNCRCADGKQLHREFLLSVVFDGKPQTFHLPADLIEEVRLKVEMRQRFEEAAGKIAHLNLRRFLRQKEKQRRGPPPV
jgi:hypothetical protein